MDILSTERSGKCFRESGATGYRNTAHADAGAVAVVARLHRATHAAAANLECTGSKPGN